MDWPSIQDSNSNGKATRTKPKSAKKKRLTIDDAELAAEGAASSTQGSKFAGGFYVAFAGQRSIINCRIFGGEGEAADRKVTFMSHGGAVNCLRTHPLNQALLFSGHSNPHLTLT